MVHFPDHGETAALQSLDDVDGPQRVRLVQRAGVQCGNEVIELFGATGRG